MSGTAQLVLGFPHRPALGKNDYLVSDCNQDAVGWIDLWPNWPGPAVVVHGPAGCGKTHLIHVWSAKSDARTVDAIDLRGRDAPEIVGGMSCCAVDDADGSVDAEALLHLYNYVAELRGQLLITSREPAARWGLQLADLSSRLGAAPHVEIKPPDAALLGAVLVKLFHDRQLKVGEDVLVYLLARRERSCSAARAIVEELDRTGLAERRGITVPLARQVLSAVEEQTPENGEN